MRERTRMHRARAASVVVVLALVAGGAWALRPIGSPAFARAGGAVTFVDRDGRPLGTILARDDQHAVAVPLERVAPVFLRAVVALEDRRFAAPHGVDVEALARAAFQAARARHAVSGGSTITMQLARLRFGIPRTPLGKLRELVIALRIERGASKRDILAAYVNRLPMGGNLIGVEAAARTYFGVPAADLDVAQSAALAALPNDPAALDPFAHRAALQRRTRAVIAYLVASGAVTPFEARDALAERLLWQHRADGVGDAPQLLFRLASATPGDGRIRTTLDAGLQAFVVNAAQQIVAGVRARNVSDAAALVVDNASGDVLAYAGSADYFDDAALGRNDGVVALRQPGSTLKPFLYELAFERRTLRPNSILSDTAAAYAIPGARIYRPADYSGRFLGPVRPRIALADSLNVPAVRTLSALGVGTFETRLHALGFAHLTRTPSYYGLGLTLGSGEVTLEEIARAYAAVARGGILRPLRYRADDPVVAPPAPIGDAASWALVTDILGDAHARAEAFGVVSQLRLPFPAAVKTGTSSDYRDTWTVGFTRRYTVATWVGNFDGAPMRHVSGVTGAAPLWNRIMLHLAERDEPARFPPPAGYRRTAICTTTGGLPDRSCPAAVTEWLDVRDRANLRVLALGPALRIDVPRDGARYRPGGRIVLRTVPALADVRWSVNGRALQSAQPSLTLHSGRYVVVARSGARRVISHLDVVAAQARTATAGFSIIR